LIKIPLKVVPLLWLFPLRNPNVTRIVVAFGIYRSGPLTAVGIHWWIFRHDETEEEREADDEIILEELVAATPTPVHQYAHKQW
jgi:hypothetical protein